ncbi:hypothetical protein NL50_13200 [Clostridium acetobutylicum]|nr:hypothetical protein NL50_13200 [Clostridium acetobutylicum]
MLKKRTKINIPIIIIVLLIVWILYSIRPVEQISLPQNKGSINHQITQLNPKMSITNNRINTSVTLGQDDLNNILYSYVKNQIKLTGLKTTVDNNQIKIYANTNIIDFIPTQVIFNFVPSMEDESIKFTLKSVYVGRILVPKSYYPDILKRINSDYISVEDNSISVKKKSISPLKISGYKADNGKVDLSLYYLTK